jgi:tetratricopeptide (TPR) repeat protein
MMTVISCSRKKQVEIQPPTMTEPPPVTQPEPTPPPIVQPPQPAPKTPKKTLTAPAPKPRVASPGDTSALKLVESGVKKMNAGNLEEAEQFFEQALRVSPNNGRPYYYLGVLAAKQKNYDRALGFLAQAEVHIHADSFWMSQVLLQQGLIYKTQNQRAQAIQKLREAVSKDPTNTWAKKELDVGLASTNPADQIWSRIHRLVIDSHFIV